MEYNLMETSSIKSYVFHFLEGRKDIRKCKSEDDSLDSSLGVGWVSAILL